MPAQRRLPPFATMPTEMNTQTTTNFTPRSSRANNVQRMGQNDDRGGERWPKHDLDAGSRARAFEAREEGWKEAGRCIMPISAHPRRAARSEAPTAQRTMIHSTRCECYVGEWREQWRARLAGPGPHFVEAVFASARAGLRPSRPGRRAARPLTRAAPGRRLASPPPPLAPSGGRVLCRGAPTHGRPRSTHRRHGAKLVTPTTTRVPETVQVATRHPPLQGFLWIGGASWMLTYIPVTPP